jgi:hypothetical protein
MRMKLSKLSRLLPVLAAGLVAAISGLCFAPSLLVGQSTEALRAGQTVASPPQGGTSSVPAGDEIVASALAALARHSSIQARLRHRCELFGQQVTGSGTYLQGPTTANLVRLELQMNLGQQASTLLQVCDGTQLWTHRDVLGNQRLWMIDLARVQEAREKAGRPPIAPMPTNLGLGGLPQLLYGLKDAMQFSRVQPARVGNMPAWAVEGTWKPLKLVFMLPDQLKEIADQKPIDLSKLPEHMPDHVVLYLGRDDSFPYRVEYRREAGLKDPPRTTGPGRGKALVTLELYEVTIGGAIDPAAFTYQPGDKAVIDETEAYLTAHGVLPRKKR